MDNDTVDCLLKYEPPWREELCKWKQLKYKDSNSACVKYVPLYPGTLNAQYCSCIAL